MKKTKQLIYAVFLFLQIAAFSFADDAAKTSDSQTASVSPASLFESALVSPDSSPAVAEAEKLADAQNKKRLEKLDNKRIEEARRLKERMNAALQAVYDVSPATAKILQKEFFGNTILAYVAAVAVLLFAWLFQHFIISFVFVMLTRVRPGMRSSKSRELFHALQSPLRWTLLLIAAHISAVMVVHDSETIKFLGRVGIILFIALFFWGVVIFTDAVFKLAEEKMGIRYAATRNLFDLSRKIIKYFMVCICALVVLDSCGANINAIIASLGIGGAALAFASKDTIANFFGSVSLIIDRPFVVGDWISACGKEGIIESIGLRSTRIRTFPRTIVTIPNSVLANETIENWTRREEIRADITIGLTYSTAPEQMELILEDFRKIISANPKVDADAGMRVNFTTFNSSSLDISIVFYIMESDTSAYYNELEKINLQLMRAVAERGLSMAFPSTSLYVESMPKRP